jgi:hypothetical protein
MINQGRDVPDKTIAVFRDETYPYVNEDDKSVVRVIPNKPFPSFEEVSKLLTKPPKKRSWFTPHFYRCLPLSIGNQYGFVLTLPFDIELTWDGTEPIEGVTVKSDEDSYFKVISLFGNGIVTIITPYFLRTSPGVNLMTINPPNYVLPNITVMTGVVETDNIRGPFTLNIKLQMPGITTTLRKGMPISGILPIPRNFSDQFTLKDAADIFTQEEIDEENKANDDHSDLRFKTNIEAKKTGIFKPDRFYMRGMDIYGNKFPDHQKP